MRSANVRILSDDSLPLARIIKSEQITIILLIKGTARGRIRSESGRENICENVFSLNRSRADIIRLSSAVRACVSAGFPACVPNAPGMPDGGADNRQRPVAGAEDYGADGAIDANIGFQVTVSAGQ